MQVTPVGRAVRAALATGLTAALIGALAACGGGPSSDSSSNTTATPQSASVPLLVSDASTEDWALIGVKVLSIALNPQGGGSPVTVYTAPTPAPVINLAQLDQLSEILGNVSIPVGTYTSAILTLAANPGDISLTVSADPESGFAAAAGTSIPSDQIQIQGKQGSSGNLTVPVTVNLQSPLVVTTTASNALDLEFDLAHPAFIVGHTPPASGGTTLWAVNFKGPVRHHPIADLTRLVLRDPYGTVTAVASDNTSITITKDVPTLPVVSPETAVSTSQSLKILVDGANGTLFYDVDAKTATTIKSFATEASGLVGKYVRIAARYQQDGSLVAVRIWASSQFNNVWLSPEGHVLHVDKTNNVITVANESGVGIPLTVDANTQFFFRTPESALGDATPIATGPAFLASGNLVRGFKVHASVVDPLAASLVAQTVDIETAAYSGKISAADSTGFAYTRSFHTSADDYTDLRLDYISSSTANGKDSSGNAITGFKYWEFAYPTLVTSGSNAIPSFIAATGGSVDFGGSIGALSASGASSAKWGDSANPTGWSAPWVVLVPAPAPLSTVVTGYANNSFVMKALAGSNNVTVDVSTTSGSATLVYQIDRTNGVITISPVDVTTSAGMSALTNGLVTNAPVKVYGVPQADGTLKAYVLTYYTGTQPAS